MHSILSFHNDLHMCTVDTVQSKALVHYSKVFRERLEISQDIPRGEVVVGGVSYTDIVHFALHNNCSTYTMSW